MLNGHLRGAPERIAHRGAPRECHENTLESFARALERGADAVELDVHATADGVVVVHHDPEVAAATPGSRPISGMTAGELGSVALTGGGQVPTLAAVMDAVGATATVYVELKGAGVGEAAAAVAMHHGHRFAFHGFDHAAVLALQARHPEFRYGFLYDAGYPGLLDGVAGAPVDDLWLHWSLVDEAVIGAAHAHGKRVIAWTVNDADMARRFTTLGIDGLCTDDVRLLGDRR